jgi:phospholipase C
MSTNDPSPEVSLHSNVVTFTDQSETITSISYVANSLVISAGQPSQAPPTITHEGNVFTIELQAGRHKTTPVADQFNQLCGGRNSEYAPSGGEGGTPGELNFFFALEIQFQYEGTAATQTVYVGQGSFFFTENWWIGGPGIQNLGTPQLVYTAGTQIVTLGMSGTHDSFTLQLSGVRPQTPINHVFVLMLENHSFDNMFAMSQIPNIIAATTADSNSFNGVTYNVQDGAPPAMPTSPGHEFTDVVTQLCGFGVTYPSGGDYPAIDNSGFAANYATTTTEGPLPQPGQIHDVMACFNSPIQVPIIYQLGSQFALCDQWFSSMPGPTWPNRFFVHGASSAGLDHSPTIEDILDWEFLSGFVYPHGSIYDALKARGISFGLYVDTEGPLEGSIPQVGALKGISILDDNVHSVKDFIQDLQGDYPYQYTFIEPNYGDIINNSYEDGSSQHPIDGVAHGEQLIQTVYEAIRNSGVWESSLLIITYDEHGGFYDHFAPPGAEQGVVAPDDNSSNKYNESGFTFEQFGVRVPAVIISPWINAQVDHTVYDHSSVLKTIEELFGLQPLTARDTNANNVVHLISSTLRTDCPTSLGRPAPEPVRPPVTAAHRMILDRQPLEPRGNHIGFLGIAMKTEHEMSGGTLPERVALMAKVQLIQTRGEARAYIQSVITRAKAAKSRNRRV